MTIHGNNFCVYFERRPEKAFCHSLLYVNMDGSYMRKFLLLILLFGCHHPDSEKSLSVYIDGPFMDLDEGIYYKEVSWYKLNLETPQMLPYIPLPFRAAFKNFILIALHIILIKTALEEHCLIDFRIPLFLCLKTRKGFSFLQYKNFRKSQWTPCSYFSITIRIPAYTTQK